VWIKDAITCKQGLTMPKNGKSFFNVCNLKDFFQVAADLVAWGVVNRRHPSDDQAQPHMDTVFEALDSAIEGVRGIKLTKKQEAFVLSLAMSLASSAIE
jgi:hypothetical protein